MYVSFEQLPQESRVWIYQADKSFSKEEEKIISDSLQNFCAQWKVHGNPLNTSFKIEYNQFIVLAVDESTEGASGCSIDSSVRVFKELSQQLGIDFFDRTKVAFLINDEIKLFALQKLAALFQSGELSVSTITFNNLVSDKISFEKNWKTPSEKSWLAKYLHKNPLTV